MTHTGVGVSTLTAALNDRSRTTIGNPWTGSYHIAIDVTDQPDTDQLLDELEALGVEAKLNLGYRDRIAIYPLESFELLLRLGDKLEKRVRTKLEILIRAKGPLPDATRQFINNRRAEGWTPEHIAAELNQRRASRGMGGRGWNARKVRRVVRGEEPATRKKRANA